MHVVRSINNLNPLQVYTTLLAGLERVVVSGLAAPHLDMIVKLATDLMTDWPPSAVLPATQVTANQRPL